MVTSLPTQRFLPISWFLSLPIPLSGMTFCRWACLAFSGLLISSLTSTASNKLSVVPFINFLPCLGMLLLIWLFTFDCLKLEGEQDEGEDLVYLVQPCLLLSDQPMSYRRVLTVNQMDLWPSLINCGWSNVLKFWVSTTRRQKKVIVTCVLLEFTRFHLISSYSKLFSDVPLKFFNYKLSP